MVTRPFTVMMVCLGLFLIIQSWMPKAVAMRKSSNLDEFMLEDQQTRRRKNYVLQMARNRDELGNFDIGPEYNSKPQVSDTNPENLQALMVDYANMIGNDVILLDDSVETRTRKRGNFKLEKKYNQAIPDPPCGCNITKVNITLGKSYIPEYIESKKCSSSPQQMCQPPYVCKEERYNVTVFRNRILARQESSPVGFRPSMEGMRSDLRHKLIAGDIEISVGCTCSSEDIFRTDNL